AACRLPPAACRLPPLAFGALLFALQLLLFAFDVSSRKAWPMTGADTRRATRRSASLFAGTWMCRRKKRLAVADPRIARACVRVCFLLVTFSLHKQRKVTRAPKVHESLCFCRVWVALKSHIDRASRAGECLYGRAPSIAPTRQRHRRRCRGCARRRGQLARSSVLRIRQSAGQQKTAPVARRRLSCLTPAVPV